MNPAFLAIIKLLAQQAVKEHLNKQPTPAQQ